MKLFRRKIMNPEILKQAIFDYRADGKKLMEDLGKKYNLDIKIENDYLQLVSRSNSSIPRKGELSKRWNYSFHGGECGFYNKKHQQSIEVVLSNSPNFGYINTWFLMIYMESTEKYKHEIYETRWTDLAPILDQFYKTGEIEYVGG